MKKQKVTSPSREDIRQLITAIGGAENLESILKDFYQRMHDDVLIGFFFTGKDLHHIAHQQTNFILNAAGMIDRFEGKGPASAHIALAPILSGHFDRRLVILRETLSSHGVSNESAKRWIQFEEGFRQIVT